MLNVVSDKPYAFVAPNRNRWWPRLLQRLLPWRLKSAYGIETVACVGLEKIQASMDSGAAIMLTPNHCRPSDPEVIHEMLHRLRVQPYMMASWHLFLQNPLQALLLQSAGTFSVYREGSDRAALTTAIDLLTEGARPLVLFPEGVQTRTNDRLSPLLDGAAFIARMAARARAEQGNARGVVIHPIAIRYRHDPDVLTRAGPALSELERKLSWRPQEHRSLAARLALIGSALLALKEIEHFGAPQHGTLRERCDRLMNGLLAPLEDEWIHGKREEHIVARVKALRSAVLHDMLHGDLPDAERVRRWNQLNDMTLAQTISFYPTDYVDAQATPEHIIETMERLEDDLTDTCRTYGALHATVTVGDALPVAPDRHPATRDDPLLADIDHSLRQMLGIPE